MCNVAESARLGRVDVRTDQVRRDLEYLFPGVVVWFGRRTGHWWAMLGDRLLEGGSPRQLTDQIRATLALSAEPNSVPRIQQSYASSANRAAGPVTGRCGYLQ